MRLSPEKDVRGGEIGERRVERFERRENRRVEKRDDRRGGRPEGRGDRVYQNT